MHDIGVSGGAAYGTPREKSRGCASRQRCEPGAKARHSREGTESSATKTEHTCVPRQPGAVAFVGHVRAMRTRLGISSWRHLYMDPLEDAGKADATATRLVATDAPVRHVHVPRRRRGRAGGAHKELVVDEPRPARAHRARGDRRGRAVERKVAKHVAAELVVVGFGLFEIGSSAGTEHSEDGDPCWFASHTRGGGDLTSRSLQYASGLSISSKKGERSRSSAAAIASTAARSAATWSALATPRATTAPSRS